VESNYTELYSWLCKDTLSFADQCTLAVDTWDGADRLVYLVYFSDDTSTTGNLTLSWNSTLLGSDYNANLKDYGADYNYNTSISSNINLKSYDNYTTDTSDYLVSGGAYRFFTVNIDFQEDTGGDDDEIICSHDCESGETETQCSGNNVEQRSCTTDSDGCRVWGDWQLMETCSSEEQCVNGQCQPLPPECVDDSDCPNGYECVNDECQLEDIPANETPDEVPDDLEQVGAVGCSSNFVCEEWSECQGEYSLNDLISNQEMSGTRTRLCTDQNNCLANFIEERSCSLQQEVVIEEKTWCNEEYTEVRDKNTGEILARLKGEQEVLNVNLNLAGEGYCPYCFDNEQNYDELGVDCGGSCIPCTEVEQPLGISLFDKIKSLSRLFWFWAILFLLSIGALVKLIGYNIALIKSETSNLLNQYKRWKRKGYDVGVLERDLKGLKK
ncbi:MAG: hypothetical protein ACP5D2_04950, partial [Candidatus Nanoarchaeia archaeon]